LTADLILISVHQFISPSKHSDFQSYQDTIFVMLSATIFEYFF